MSHLSTSGKPRRFGAAALAITTSVVLAASGFSAMAQSGKSSRHAAPLRELRAYATPYDSGRWVPVNGAQIMGGFGGPGDFINSVTGEIRPR
jgi:hypothetical protein